MTLRKQWWLVIPLAAALGCAGSQQSQQKVTKAGGNSTLVDEGPASASPQGAGAATAGAAGAAGAAGGQAANAQLVPFQGANGFTVLMPPNPQLDQRTQDTPGGQVQVHIAQAQDASGKYMTSLSEFPKGSLSKVKSKDLLDSLQQATVQSMGGTLVSALGGVLGLPAVCGPSIVPWPRPRACLRRACRDTMSPPGSSRTRSTPRAAVDRSGRASGET